MTHLKLCLVTHIQATSWTDYKDFIVQAVQGGVTLVQLREKTRPIAEIYHFAQELKDLLEPFKVPLIINDYVEIAQAVHAGGVHLGQGDFSPLKARQMLGPDKILGWSVETLEEVEAANQMTCIDYVAASAIFPSQTKLDCKTIWGLEGLLEITQKSRYPVMGIGGIHLGNVASVIAQGACGVAVVGAVHNAPCPEQAARSFIEAMNH